LRGAQQAPWHGRMDSGPNWTTFEYYQAHGHPSDLTPVVLLPDQQTSANRYYLPYGRDFPVVYAR
jgi:hypothetical protein